MKPTMTKLAAALAGIAAIAAGLAAASSCTMKEKSEKTTFIGRSDATFENAQYSPEAMLSLGRLSDPQLSPDGKHILYGVSYTSIKDNRSCRNLYVCDTEGNGNTLLTKEGSSINNARWCDGGKAIAFLQDGRLCKAGIKHKGVGKWKLGKTVILSKAGLGISEFSLSPDESQVLYISSVKSHVDTPKSKYDDLDKALAYETDDLMYRHWDHWVEEIPHSYIAPFTSGKESIGDVSIDILGGPDVLFELPTEPFGGIEQLCWSPCGRYIAYSCRKLEGKQYAFSTCTDIYIYDILTGFTTKVTDGGGYDTDPVWSPDGSRLAWISMARDGYEADKQNIKLAGIEYDTDEDGQGSLSITGIRCLTDDFKYNASGPVWAEDSRSIWFNALAEGVQGIFRLDITAEGECCTCDACAISRVTPEDAWYNFSSPFGIIKAEDGSDAALLASWQSMNFPAELVRIDLGDASFTGITHENDHILGQFTAPDMEARTIKTVDGKDMLTWVMYPPDFDPSKVYPAILICLGGPQGTNDQSWSYRWNYRLMAAQGYIVILPNRRGTTAFGQEWCEQISGDYCGLNIQDYLSAARALKAEPYVGKMAACGASYGGYSVYYLCGNHDDTFDCFIAHAGIFNEEHMYYTTEEMWFPNWDNGGLQEYAYAEGKTGPAGDGVTFGGMQQAGSPWSKAPKAVRHYANSPHKFVESWHTPLLCIHGGSDFRVPVDEGMAAFNCAQMMGVPSRLIVFPNENHWILKPQNALFWHREYFSWLDKWCK